MKKTVSKILTATALAATISLGGCSGGGNSTSDSSLVTLSVGRNAKTATMLIERDTLLARVRMYARQAFRFSTAMAAIPLEVKLIRFTVEASDINVPIVNEVTLLDPNEITVRFSVPNGKKRNFKAEAYNTSTYTSGEKPIYQSEVYTTDLTGYPARFDFHLTASAISATEITGVMRDALQTTFTSARITFTPPANAAGSVSAAINSAGQYTVALDPGDYNVTVSGYPLSPILMTVIANPNPPNNYQTLNPQVSQPTYASRIFSDAAGTYSGWAVASDNKTNYPFTLTVDTLGNVTGTNTTVGYPKILSMTGNLTSVGTIPLTYSGEVSASTITDCATWSGTLNTVTGMFTGTWTRSNNTTNTVDGAWTATKVSLP